MMTQITSVQAAILAINSLALGGLLFLLSSGLSLIFGLMRIPSLMHGSFFMLGAYFGMTLLGWGTNFWLAAVLSGLAVAAIGGVIERLLLRRLEGQVLPQVLLTLGTKGQKGEWNSTTHLLNEPNDVVVDSHGRVWFTDPCYGDRGKLELDHESVYRLDPRPDGGHAITRVTFDTDFANSR